MILNPKICKKNTMAGAVAVTGAKGTTATNEYCKSLQLLLAVAAQ